MAAPSLRSVGSVAAERPITVGEALGILRDAAEALGEAHARGTVHGAVCAENLVLDDQGVTRLCRDTLTPSTLSPEQEAGGRPDVRSDVYGLGATISDLLGGTEALPEPLQRLLGRMTAREPGERYGSMDDVLTALEAGELMTGYRGYRPGTEAQVRRERRFLLVGIVVALGALMLALALLVALGPTPASRGKPPPSYEDLVEKMVPLSEVPKPTTSR